MEKIKSNFLKKFIKSVLKETDFCKFLFGLTFLIVFSFINYLSFNFPVVYPVIVILSFPVGSFSEKLFEHIQDKLFVLSFYDRIHLK